MSLPTPMIEQSKILRVSVPGDPQKQVSPVPNACERERILSYIAQGAQQGGHILVGRSTSPDCGYFLDPTVFGNVTSKSQLCVKRPSDQCHNTSIL